MAAITLPLHYSLSCARLFHIRTPRLLRSSSTTSTHLIQGVPLLFPPPGFPSNILPTQESYILAMWSSKRTLSVLKKFAICGWLYKLYKSLLVRSLQELLSNAIFSSETRMYQSFTIPSVARLSAFSITYPKDKNRFHFIRSEFPS